MSNSNFTIVFKGAVVALTFVGTLTGCASRENSSLARARFDLQTAQQNPQLVTNAPTVLAEAATAYDRAENTWRRTKDRTETDHLVYLTEQTLQIAREESRRKLGQNLAQIHRDTSRVAAGNLRAESNNARARANISEMVTEEYRKESDENRRLIGELDKQILALRSKETARGLEFTLSESVLFESAKSELKPGAVLKLNPLADFLKRFPERRVAIEGHTDSMGSVEYNNELSQKRADAVRQLLTGLGVDESRIVAKGMGRSFPIASNKSDAGRLQNRRVQIILLQPK